MLCVSTRSVYRYCAYHLSTHSELLQQTTTTNCELLSEPSFLHSQKQIVPLYAKYTQKMASVIGSIWLFLGKFDPCTFRYILLKADGHIVSVRLRNACFTQALRNRRRLLLENVKYIKTHRGLLSTPLCGVRLIESEATNLELGCLVFEFLQTQISTDEQI
jgi:hypothetical protein